MAAFTSACLTRRRWAACALLVLLLQACSVRAPPPRPILAERCLTISASSPLTLPTATPGGGTLRIGIRQRGISLRAELIDHTVIAATLSPVDRYGEMTILADSRWARSYTVRIFSRDSPDIAGEACVSAELVDASDRVRRSAEHAFAEAGGATRARLWQAAFDDYLAAARQFDRLDARRAAEARQAMAFLAYRDLNRARDAYVLAQRALTDFGAHADRGMRSDLLQLQAAIVVESKRAQPDTRRERALQLLDMSGALARQARFGKRELARLTVLRGFLEYATDHPVAAAEFFAQAAGECSALRDWECDARARMNSASIAEETSNSAVALQGYADAQRALSPEVAPGLVADIWDNLGRLQGSIGLFSLGEQSQLNAIRLYAQIGNCDGARRALSTLGTILVHVGNVNDALAYLYVATSHDCAALLSIANERIQPDFAAAGVSAPAQFATARQNTACGNLPPPGTLSADGEAAVFRALLAINYGATLEADPVTAQRCLAAARPYALTSRTQLWLANAAGAAYIDSAEPAQARDSFLRALAIADRAGLAATQLNRGIAYLGLAQAAVLAHQHGEALRYSALALAAAGARADVGEVVSALRVLASSLRDAGERQRAEQTLRTAVNLIEEVPLDDLDVETRATYLATQHGVFEELTDLLVADALAASNGNAETEQTWAAFAAAERGRARSLQYAVSQAANNDPLHLHAGAAAQYQELFPRIAAAATAAGTDAGWNAAVGQLESLSMAHRAVPESANAARLLPQLNRLDATLVEFATGRNDMFAFVIDAGDIHVVPLWDRRRISNAATDFYERLHDPDAADDDTRRAARRLAELVLWPLTRYVRRARVIFVADDSLATVPFTALPWTPDLQGPLVLEHGESAVAPSALFIMQHAGARVAGGAAPRFELIGDPIFQAGNWRRECSAGAPAVPVPAAQRYRSATQWNESLPQLPGSRAEVLAIADLARASWPSSQIDIYLGCRATPSALRRAAGAAPALLHIATHGYVDALRPRLSALALTREDENHPEGGVFGLLDILDTKTVARLVVLSACDTSRGRLLPGEGVLGPAQAFLQSGAASVLASYWSIDDDATASFMRTFYKYLLTDHLPVATALRRAQLEQSSTHSAHNWAGFALFGWPDGAL